MAYYVRCWYRWPRKRTLLTGCTLFHWPRHYHECTLPEDHNHPHTCNSCGAQEPLS